MGCASDEDGLSIYYKKRFVQSVDTEFDMLRTTEQTSQVKVF